MSDIYTAWREGTFRYRLSERMEHVCGCQGRSGSRRACYMEFEVKAVGRTWRRLTKIPAWLFEALGGV